MSLYRIQEFLLRELQSTTDLAGVLRPVYFTQALSQHSLAHNECVEVDAYNQMGDKIMNFDHGGDDCDSNDISAIAIRVLPTIDNHLPRV